MIKRKILFLHTELAGYFLSCVNNLLSRYPVEVHIIKLPINKEAPFSFELNKSIHFYDRNDYTSVQLFETCAKINPDFIFCAGWNDEAYLRIAKHFRGKIPTALVLDNHWKGNAKQHIATLLSPYFLLNRFSHIWIPGLPQYEYARRLGFKPATILTGMYSADVDYFKAFYQEHAAIKHANYPKRFLYIGRYVESKGVKELWDAFQDLSQSRSTDWELWCAGTGNLEIDFPKNEKIKNFGFVQPKDLGKLIKECGVFVLPSHYEPWGVVIHEMTACGFPLLCSDRVGAATSFLVDGYNGFSFKAKNKEALKESMLKFIELDDEHLVQMSAKSHAIASCINPEIWATKIWHLTQNYHA